MAPTGPKIPSFLSPCPAYKGILPLRLLQLEPHLASITSGLMDHSEDKDMEGAGEDEVVRLFKEDWGCSFTEEEIIRADGILDVNSVQHRLEGLTFFRKLFSSTSPPLTWQVIRQEELCFQSPHSAPIPASGVHQFCSASHLLS